MVIRHITIRDFGAVSFYEAALNRSLNIIGSRYTPEISAAISFLLCSRVQQAIPETWLCATTRLTAVVHIETCEYTVTAAVCDGRLTLTATDHDGVEVTNTYQYLLSHCPEQNAAEYFDGQDKTLPLRLYWYRNWEDAPENISDRTDSLTDTKTFRSHLLGYIKAFRPEPLNCKKPYLAAMNPEGQFEVFYPGVSGEVSLSETEEKLFLYICFLNVAEFWTDIENIRDLHHEKKPLVIQNFLEYLDASTDIRALIGRTGKLQRQIILFTLPRGEEKKWLKKEDYYGMESGNGTQNL